ncbi:hypothetical protein [Marinospirillum insulare]|uniref:PIN domain-containing protein n=1 Tax=Marinospirillum insulare TaxID=217169 RepID=A0ABQ5ZWQ1_9GAMM|nr:hypothetical protein [Marinospirillum insulare]GLR64429.1 hypothetical protein GCM10007878_18670 [Marinospirillum insulare]
MVNHKLIIDTNLLLLLIIGSLDDGVHIRKSKRLNNYTLADYDLLVKILNKYKIYITPYLSTEISNLIDFYGELKERAMLIARELFKQFEEIDTNIIKDSESKEFICFGLTDASLVRLVKDFQVLTNDMRLYSVLCNANATNAYPFYEIE